MHRRKSQTHLNYRHLALFLFGLTITSHFAAAQADLQTQYYELLKNKTWEDYKVVKIHEINGFWQSVTDTLNQQRQLIQQSQTQINLLNGRIDSLNAQLTQIKNQLASSELKNNTIGFFGNDLSKTVYHLLVWTLVSVLIVGLILVYLMYNRSNVVTVQTKKDHLRLENEFNDFREKAQTKQVKLKRELQTAINVLEENKIRM